MGRNGNNKIIGVYDYTVILTIASIIVSVVGMMMAMGAHFRVAIACLAVSGLLDTFDGKVARTKKDRTNDEKLYGIQLDSLADIICFGVCPGMICYLLGVRSVIGIIAICFYVVCGVIRLAYFNVLETNRQSSEHAEEKVYHGLPITSIAVILPATFLLEFVTSAGVFQQILFVMLVVTGICFVVDIRIKQLKNWVIGALIVVVAVIMIVILLFTKYRVPKPEIIVNEEQSLFEQMVEDHSDEPTT